MTQDEFDALNGRLQAVTTTLTAIIPTLPQLAAAQAAVALKMDQLAQQQADAEEGTPAAEVQTRDAILDAYVELLSTVAKRG